MRKWEENDGFYKWDFAELISEDAVNLAMSDAVMVGSTLLCVPFVKVSLPWLTWCLVDSFLCAIADVVFPVDTADNVGLAEILRSRPRLATYRSSRVPRGRREVDFPQVRRSYAPRPWLLC